jgi:hypothetical protein
VGWAEHVFRIGETRDTYAVFVGNGFENGSIKTKIEMRE